MDRINDQQNDLNQQLADSKIYEEEFKNELKELLNKQSEISQEHDICEEEWMALSEELETLEAELNE